MSTNVYHPETDREEHDRVSKTKKVLAYGWDADNLQAVKLAADSSGSLLSGMQLPTYDYVSMALSDGDTTETYAFKTGGSGGTTVATVTIVYTSSSRDVLSSVTKS